MQWNLNTGGGTALSWTPVLSFLAFALIAVGVVLLLRLGPSRVSDDLQNAFAENRTKTLRGKVRAARAQASGKPLSGVSGWKERFRLFLQETEASLALQPPKRGRRRKNGTREDGKSGGRTVFATVCFLAVALFVLFGWIGVRIGNVFLAPVLAAYGFAIPFLWVRRSLRAYRARVTEELETGLSVLAASYVRSGDVLSAVRENLPYLRSPVKEPFARFLFDASSVDADVTKAIEKLKGSFSHPVFREFCDLLAACQEDRTLSDLLLACAAKLADERLVNSELVTVTENAKKEYGVLAGLVFGTVPLLWLLNREWLNALLYTVPGQIVTAVSALTVLVTFLLLGKALAPVGYREEKRNVKVSSGKDRQRTGNGKTKEPEGTKGGSER